MITPYTKYPLVQWIFRTAVQNTDGLLWVAIRRPEKSRGILKYLVGISISTADWMQMQSAVQKNLQGLLCLNIKSWAM